MVSGLWARRPLKNPAVPFPSYNAKSAAVKEYSIQLTVWNAVLPLSKIASALSKSSFTMEKTPVRRSDVNERVKSSSEGKRMGDEGVTFYSVLDYDHQFSESEPDNVDDTLT